MREVTGGAVAQHRRDLGLSEMRPSEMVEGLDAVAKRSERQEQIERMKQRDGRIIMNEAVHVDEKGRIWKQVVLFSIIGFFAAVGALVLLLMYLANATGTSVQKAASDTRAMLAQYTTLVYQFEPLAPGKNLTVDEFKQRLTVKMAEKLKQQEESLTTTGPARQQERILARKAIHLLEMAKKYEDGFGLPFVIEVKSAGVFTIRSTGTGGSGETFSAEISLPRASATQLEAPAP